MAIRGSEPALDVIVPHLVIVDLDETLRFYTTAFDAVVLYRSASPTGGGEHVHIRIGQSLVFLSTEEPAERVGRVEVSHLASPETLGGSTCIFQLRVTDVDAAYRRAVAAGATPVQSPAATFWGDRYSWIRDPAGHVWALCAVEEVLSPEEVDDRLRKLIAQQQRSE